MICPYCSTEHDVRDLCRARPTAAGVSRRRFLFLGASAATAVVAAPLMPLAPTGTLYTDIIGPFTLNGIPVVANPHMRPGVIVGIDSVLKDLYLPFVREAVERDSTFLRLLDA